MNRLYILAVSLFLAGCHTPMPTSSMGDAVGKQMNVLASGDPQNHGLILLSWVGGISTLAGIAALVITKGSMGMRAVIAGVCLVLLNVVVANYLSWIMIPALIGTGCISLCWAYVTIRNLMSKEE